MCKESSHPKNICVLHSLPWISISKKQKYALRSVKVSFWATLRIYSIDCLHFEKVKYTYTYIRSVDDQSTLNISGTGFSKVWMIFLSNWLMLVFSSFLAFPTQRNDVCSRTNIAFYVSFSYSYISFSFLSLARSLSFFLSFFFFSFLENTSMQSSTSNDRKRMSMTQSNLLSFSDSIEKRIHKANARELVDRASLKALRSLFPSNLEQLFETGRYRIKRDITSILKTVCVRLFFLSLFFLLPRLHMHFLLFFLIQSAVQIHIYEAE